MSTKLKNALMVAIMIMFTLINLSISRQSDEGLRVETYTVKQGDTFWSVSCYYRDKDKRNLYIFDYQDEMREMNPQLKVNRNQVYIGDELKVRYKP